MTIQTVPLPTPLSSSDPSATCRETMRLLRRMLARLPWARLPFAQRQRMAREVQRLESDLNLALLILEKGRPPKQEDRSS